VLIANPFNDTKLTRTTSRSFKVNPDVEVTITNKYGKVVVKTWDRSTVKVEASVTAFGKNNDIVQKLLKRVDLDFEDSERYVSIETVLDRKSGFFQDIWNSVSDGANIVFNKNRIQINYELYVPEMAQITIDNKFGDVILGAMNAPCKIKVAHGNLRAESFKKSSRLHVNFGQASIQYLEEAVLVVQVGEANVEAANLLEINSHSSEISIGSVNELRLNSRNDKIRILKVALLSGKTTLSKINIDQFRQDLSLKISFGYIEIREVTSNFGQIDIDGRLADITLRFSPEAYLNWKVKAKEDRISLPSAAQIDHQSYNDKKATEKEGTLGTKKSQVGYVSISAEGGHVALRIL